MPTSRPARMCSPMCSKRTASRTMAFDPARVEHAAAPSRACVGPRRAADETGGKPQDFAGRRANDVFELQIGPPLREERRTQRRFVGMRGQHDRVDASGRCPGYDVDGNVAAELSRDVLEDVAHDANLIGGTRRAPRKHEPYLGRRLRRR